MGVRRRGYFEGYLDDQIQEILDAISKLEHPGKIDYFARSTPPDGWLEANGALISRTTYADLWAEAQVSGNLVSEVTWAAGNYGSYGQGDGSTTFRIPDLRDYFICGLPAAGRTLGSYQADAMQGHKHLTSSTSVQFTSGGGNYAPTGSNINAHNSSDPTTDGINGTPRTATTTHPKNVTLLVCIKT